MTTKIESKLMGGLINAITRISYRNIGQIEDGWPIRSLKC